MPKTSSGILLYKFHNSELKFFIVHPGGPFWKDKDKGSWSIPKGEIDDNSEVPFERARKELKEETGIVLEKEEKDCIFLGDITQKSGKKVIAWASEGDWSGLLICSSYAEVEWPYKSGKKIKVPEVDKAGFFNMEKTKEKINSAQVEFLLRLETKLNINKG